MSERTPPTKERLAELMVLANVSSLVPNTWLQEVFDECDSLAEEHIPMVKLYEQLVTVLRVFHADLTEVLGIIDGTNDTNGDG